MLSRAQFRIWPNWFRAMDVSLGWPLSRDEFPEGVARYFFGKICVIGSGNMVRAVVDGVVKNNPERAHGMIVFGHSDVKKLSHYQAQGVAATLESPSDLPEIKGSRQWVLGCKPHQVKDALETLPIKPGDHVISLAAGVTTEQILAWSPVKDIGISRVMPNIPASVQRGVAGVFDTSQSALIDCVAVRQWLTAAGGYVNVWKEDQMHAVTATSGSGPAYYFEAMHYMEYAIASYTLNYPKACDAVFEVFNVAIAKASMLGPEATVAAIETDMNPLVSGIDNMMSAAEQKSRFLAGEPVENPVAQAELKKLTDIGHSGQTYDPVKLSGKTGSEALQDIALSFIVAQYLSAQRFGLSAERQAWPLVLKTAQGSVALAKHSVPKRLTLSILADNVTSPDGTTDAARKTAQAMGVWKVLQSMVRAECGNALTPRATSLKNSL